MNRFPYPQQAEGPTTLARFQLAKFSYATTSVNHRGPMTWSHVFGNGDIIGTFEKHTIFSPGRVLFVVRNNLETLEAVGITDLLKEFEDQIHSRQDGPRPTFAVVVKLPCLAVKYPQSPGYVRRFQIKFSSDRDFYSTLAILSEINCPFSESNVSSIRPMSRSASSLSNLGHIGAISGPQNGVSTATRTPMPSLSMPSSHWSTSSFNGITNVPPGKAKGAILPSSSSSSTTVGGGSRPFSSSTFSSTHRSPFEPTYSAINIPPANTHPEADKFKRASTSTDHHGLDLPPKRVLPFSNPEAKRSRSASKAAEDTSPKTSNTGTLPLRQTKYTVYAISSTLTSTPHHPPETTNTPSSHPVSESKKEQKPLTTKGKRKSKAPQDATPAPPPPCSTTPINHPPQATTGITAPPTTSLPNEPPTEPKIPTLLPTPADLAQYISNPSKERTAALENWICTHLEDDSFLQLCVDVESVWTRFAVGR